MTDTRTETFLDVAERDTGGKPKEFRHAMVSGVLDRALLNRPLIYAASPLGRQSKQWVNKSNPLSVFLERLCTFHHGDKDGSGFLQGAVSYPGGIGPRKASSMHRNELLAFDTDAGWNLDDIRAQLPADLLYVTYTTHSHLKTTTELNKVALLQLARRRGRDAEPNADDARDFLLNVKRCNPKLLVDATYTFDEKKCTVKHAPWPRMRIVFVLSKPFSLLTEAERALWSAKYLALADKFGIVVDESCADPSRLFYAPRIPRDAVIEGRHEIHVRAGKLLDLDAIEVPPEPERRKKEKQAGSTSAAGGSAAQPGGFVTLHMLRFLALCSDSFMAAEWIGTIAPEEIRRAYEGAVDATCPMTGGHDPKNTCFHVKNAEPGDSFNIWCMHDECKELTKKANGKQDRGRYLDELCRKHGIKSADELLEFCDEAAQASWAPNRLAHFQEIDEPAGGEPDMTILDRHLIPAPRFPVEIFGGLQRWMEQQAEQQNCPVDYVGASVLSVAATVIGHTRKVRAWPGFVQPCVLWNAITGEVSQKKTGQMGVCLGVLERIEAELAAKALPVFREYEERKHIAASVRKTWEKTIDDAVKVGKSVEEMPPRPEGAEEPPEPPLPRLRIGEATAEKVLEMLAVQRRGLLWARQELAGLLGGLNQYRGGKGNDRQLLLEAYDAGSLPRDRMKASTMVETVHLNMLGGFQPDKVDGMLLKGDDDGLFARVAPYWPDRVPLKIPRGNVADDGQLYRVASRLLTLDFDATGKPVVIPLDNAARAMFETWYLSQEKKVAVATGLYAGALGKRQGLVLRLSLVLEHIRWACGSDPFPPSTVGLDALKDAIALADDYLDGMLLRVLGGASVTPAERAARVLATAIVDEGRLAINVRELKYRKRVKNLPAELVETAVHHLVERGWLSKVERTEKEYGGRPNGDFTVNPRVHELARKT